MDRRTNEASLQTGRAEVDGAQLYYEIAGSGPALVLAHAGIADRRMWDGQISALAPHHRVIRYDMRGYGRSGGRVGDARADQDLYGLLRALDVDQAILVGCSQGGTAALDLALDHPDVASGLVLVSAIPTGYRLEGAPPAALLEFMAAYEKGKLDQAAELATRVWLDGPRRTPAEVDPAVRAQALAMMHDVMAAGSVDMEGDGDSRPAVDRLAELRAPTLIVVGDQDDPAIVAAGEYMGAHIRGAATAVIPGAAHLCPMEKPEEFNRILLEFARHGRNG